jgi:hypothetical protein
MTSGKYSVELLSKIMQFVAEDAIGPSSLRNQTAGTREAVLRHLGKIALAEIPNDSFEFAKWLDDQTESLRHKLPDPDQPWGVARKALNLFLRSCVYNYYLREGYSLVALEPLLEVPLDSKVGIGLYERADKGALPKWDAIKRLKPEASALFQKCATLQAAKMNLPARVFLDNYLWVKDR